MGTKTNPGNFDCYANAEPDEPMFILLGRDPDAPRLVDAWATMRAANGEDMAKVQEAYDCSAAMREYLKKIGKTERIGGVKDGQGSPESEEDGVAAFLVGEGG